MTDTVDKDPVQTGVLPREARDGDTVGLRAVGCSSAAPPRVTFGLDKTWVFLWGMRGRSC